MTPEQDLISLEEFIPIWTKIMKQLFKKKREYYGKAVEVLEKKYNVNYGTIACCFVGEANLFEHYDLNCSVCYYMAFGHYGRLMKDSTYFPAYKKALYGHMKRFHPEKLVRINYQAAEACHADRISHTKEMSKNG